MSGTKIKFFLYLSQHRNYCCNFGSFVNKRHCIVKTYTMFYKYGKRTREFLGPLFTFIELFFCKKISLSRRVEYVVDGSMDQWVSESVSQSEMYVCHTNQIGSTINSQSNLLLVTKVTWYFCFSQGVNSIRRHASLLLVLTKGFRGDETILIWKSSNVYIRYGCCVLVACKYNEKFLFFRYKG